MEAHAGFMAGGNKEPAATKATPILAEQNPVLVSVTGNAQTNGHAHVVLAVNKAVQQVDHRLEGSQVNYVLVAEAVMLGAEPARASRTTASPAGCCSEQATDGKVYSWWLLLDTSLVHTECFFNLLVLVYYLVERHVSRPSRQPSTRLLANLVNSLVYTWHY
jgi:hypothetical protein